MSFTKIKPNWLMGLKGRPLELDGYCEKLNLAFEHQGLQHYQDIKNVKIFQDQYHIIKERDDIKYKICKERNVNVLYIPALLYKTPIEELHILIGKELDSFNILFDREKLKPVKDVLNLNGIKTMNAKSELEKIKLEAIARGGRCLSESFTGRNNNKIELECADKHIWKVFVSSFKQGNWCHKCAKKSKIKIEEVKALAASKNLECLSNNYINSTIHLDFRCLDCNHEFKRSYHNLKIRKPCPKCSILEDTKRKTQSIDFYKQLAKSFNGECLSETVRNCFELLKWRCEFGHEWLDSGANVKHGGRWCRECRKIKRK